MARPFVLVGFTYLLTLTAAVYFGAVISLMFGAICLLGFCVSLFINRARQTMLFPIAFLAAAVAFGSFSAYDMSSVAPFSALDDQDVLAVGTICELPTRENGRYCYVMSIDSIEPYCATGGTAPQLPESIRGQGRIRFTTQKALMVDVFGKVEGKFHLYAPNGGTGFTSRSSYASKGIFLFGYLYEYESYTLTPPEEKPLYYYALKVRKALINSIREMLPPEESGLITGVLLGDRSNLSSETEAAFRTAGVSHLLSVSGLHMATMAQLFLLLFGLFHIPKKLTAVLAALGVFCFMAVTGFVPSVMRSGIMYLLLLLGIVVSRKPDSLNSLGVAAFLLCVSNPYAAADIGLLLSFSATLGLILFCPRLIQWFQEKYKRVRFGKRALDVLNAALSTSVAAILCTLPITLLAFGSVSLIAPLSNLLQLVPSTLLMTVSALAAVLYLLGPLSFLAMPLSVAAGILSNYLQGSARWAASIPFASISASHGFVAFWLAGTLLLGALALLWTKKSKQAVPVAALLSAVLLFTGVFSYQISMRGVARIGILGYGEHLEVVFVKDNRAAVLALGEDAASIRYFLSDQNLKDIDFLLVRTQPEESAAVELMQDFEINHLVLPEENIVTSTFQDRLASVQNLYEFGENAEANLFGEERLVVSSGANPYMGLEVYSVRILFCSGDTRVELLPEEWKNTDIAVFRGIPEKAELLRPELAVFSVSEEETAVLPAEGAAVGNAYCIAGAEGDLLIDIGLDGRIKLRRAL